VLCLDRNSGRELWRQVAAEEVPHEGGHETNTHASGSPVTDGKHLYVSFGSRGVYCYDLDGNLQWKRDLGRMETRNDFGEGSSPALYQDTLVIPWDHEGQSFIIALDARTGETRWKVDRDEPTTWATPLIVPYKGRVQVITNGTNRVRSYDLNTGQVIWECGGQAQNPIATPVTDGSIVYCMTGHRGYAVYAIPLGVTGDVTDTDKVLWHREDAGSYVSSPVLYKGQLYFTKGREGVIVSLDAKTGEPIIPQQRLPGAKSLYASPVAAADRIYFTDRDGTTIVIRHGSELQVLATNKLPEGIDASPAIIGKEMFLRGAEHLYCIVEQ
jgi:outer membrane protein assembly factor BamB